MVFNFLCMGMKSHDKYMVSLVEKRDHIVIGSILVLAFSVLKTELLKQFVLEVNLYFAC